MVQGETLRLVLRAAPGAKASRVQYIEAVLGVPKEAAELLEGDGDLRLQLWRVRPAGGDAGQREA